AHADEQLPAYARPVFVRLKKTLETTGTFKYRKTDLVHEGFDPSAVADALCVRDGARGYRRLTPELYAQLMKGEQSISACGPAAALRRPRRSPPHHAKENRPGSLPAGSPPQ